MSFEQHADARSSEKEERSNIVAKLTQAILVELIFRPKNAMTLMLMIMHNITPKDVEKKIGNLLDYLEETKEVKT